MDAAARGATALSNKDFPGAVKHYSTAIAINPGAVDYYIKRSTAYTRLSPPNSLLALFDAETAVVLAQKRGKRELISQAQLRRGVSLFAAERWADAGKCFEWVKKLTPDEKSLAIWGLKVQGKLKDLEEGDARGEVKVKEIPDIDTDKVAKDAKEAEAESVEKTSKTDQSKPPIPQPAVKGVQTLASKIRHDWYQSAEAVTISLMVKGVPKGKTVADIQSGSVAISFPLPTGSDFDFSLDPLFAKVDPEASTYKVMSTKIELTLKKATPGQKWTSLEGTRPLPSDEGNLSNRSDDRIKDAVLGASSNNSGPSYPTSSKSGPKNWDKVASDLTKPKKSDGEKNEGSEDLDFSDDEGDPTNAFFKKLYKNSDPDTQRAMMKSFQESNGTALSTNWAEVGKKKVETSPPDGMVAKSWGE